jgi:hypothetical protein
MPTSGALSQSARAKRAALAHCIRSTPFSQPPAQVYAGGIRGATSRRALKKSLARVEFVDRPAQPPALPVLGTG